MKARMRVSVTIRSAAAAICMPRYGENISAVGPPVTNKNDFVPMVREAFEAIRFSRRPLAFAQIIRKGASRTIAGILAALFGLIVFFASMTAAYVGMMEHLYR
jgi:hypothetical protein